MNAWIERLDRWFREHRPDHLAGLNPGATPDQIRELEVLIGLPVPPLFKELYAWRDGEDWRVARGRFQENWSFMKLEEVQDCWEVMEELLQAGEFELKNWWDSGWVPFLENGGGDHLCLDLTGSFGGTPGQILEFWHDDSPRTIVYPSLERWLEVFVTTLEEGIWTLDPEHGFFQPEERAWKKAEKRLNPGYPLRHEAK